MFYLNHFPTYSLYIYIHIHIETDRQMVDFSESDTMIKISGKVNKSGPYNGFSGNISCVIHRRTSSDCENLLQSLKKIFCV